MMDNPPLAPIRRYDWAWVAAASALLLISFVILASWKNSITSSDSTQPTTASRTPTSPTTEGSGSSSPKPFTPARAARNKEFLERTLVPVGD